MKNPRKALALVALILAVLTILPFATAFPFLTLAVLLLAIAVLI